MYEFSVGRRVKGMMFRALLDHWNLLKTFRFVFGGMLEMFGI